MKKEYAPIKSQGYQNYSFTATCTNCNKEVDLFFLFCPYCGVKFIKNISFQPPHQLIIQSNPEIKKHLENLSRFANFIMNGANPKTKMKVLWILANDKKSPIGQINGS